jgi:hypothetical protein
MKLRPIDGSNLYIVKENNNLSNQPLKDNRSETEHRKQVKHRLVEKEDRQEKRLTKMSKNRTNKEGKKSKYKNDIKYKKKKHSGSVTKQKSLRIEGGRETLQPYISGEISNEREAIHYS